MGWKKRIASFVLYQAKKEPKTMFCLKKPEVPTLENLMRVKCGVSNKIRVWAELALP